MQRSRGLNVLTLLSVFLVLGCGNNNIAIPNAGDTESATQADVNLDSDADEFIDVGGKITLIDVTDGRIFQRDSDGQYDLLVKGTYQGDPEVIQARVLKDETDDVVTPWIAIDDAPNDGSFSGVLKDIPGGGWYNLEVRIFHSTTAIDRGNNKFGVGALIACTGQSHIDYWFDPGSGSGAPDAHDLTRMYRHKQVRQNGKSWTGWQPVTGMGARVFANMVTEGLNIPVGLLDYGVNGASLWRNKSITPDRGWWLPDSSSKHPNSNNYSVFKAGLESIDNKVEAVLWVQGHTDAMNGGVTKEKYMAGLEELFRIIRTDTDLRDLPIFISLVTRQAGPPFSGNDASIQAVRTAEEQFSAQDPHTYIGCTTIDLPLRGDNIHHTPEGQKIQANRLAQSVLHIVLGKEQYTYHRGPQIENYQVVDSTTIDIHLAHRGGTDFTPETKIKGFEVLGGSTGRIVSVNRETDTTIRIVISGNTNSIATVRYLYGGNPSNLNLSLFAKQYAHDNSPLSLPLEGSIIEPL